MQNFFRSIAESSVRWRLLALVSWVALAFFAGGLILLPQREAQTTASSAPQRKAQALRDLQMAFGDYRYWRLAGTTAGRAEKSNDTEARAKVTLELTQQRLQQRLTAAASAAPTAAQTFGGEFAALKQSPVNERGQLAQTAELRARLDSLYERIANQSDMADEAASAAALASRPGSLAWITLAGLLLIAAMLATTLIRSIVRPLRQLVDGAESLTVGALDAPLPVAREDEFGAIAKALDSFRERAKEWDYLAYHDPLTGLANRARLEPLLTKAITTAQESSTALVLLYIGLDQLTSINDSFGPASGDEFLKIASRRLRASLPESSALFYMGGPHFAVLPPAVANDMHMTGAADLIARNLVNDMARPFSLQEQEIEMAIKLGIVTCPQDGVTHEELIANAYGALTHARRTPGSSFQFYTRQITEKARQRLALASQLRRAVAAGELRVHYQPVLNVATNQIVAAEALMRWQHPTRGLLMPGEFIHVAEESGAINAMGAWCLATACADARSWREEGLEPIKLAVNLSARQLSEPGLVDIIQRTLEEAKMSPSDLELEITESTVMSDPDSSVRVLRHLKSLGISLSVDDFGTGYSSLTYLQRFPLDKIKIDRSFVSRLNRRRKDELIIAATTGLATDLGLEVVAEGVETHEQMRLLRQLGCHLMQGFLFSRGLPQDDFVKWAAASPSTGVAPPPDIRLN